MLGVVSSAAKTIVSNAISDIAKTSLNQFSKADNKPKGGLVSYDSDSGSEPDAPGSSTAPKQHTGFVPRAVTMKNLVEKPNLVKTVMDSKPVRAISTTARNWTVTDVETRNPSVHSDNSTGSTTSSWIITPQRPSSAMSVDGDTASVNSKDTAAGASKWTVTNLKKAIDEEATAKTSASVSSGTSTPSSSGSSGSSSGSTLTTHSTNPTMASVLGNGRKRPSVDDSTGSDYDNALDRGRTKKVKKLSVVQNYDAAAVSQNKFSFGRQNSSNGDGASGNNPFQKRQDWQNQSKINGNGHNSNGYQNGSQGNTNRNNWQHHSQKRDHSQQYRNNSDHGGGHYNRNNDRGPGGDRHYSNGGHGSHGNNGSGGRRKSFGGNFRENKGGDSNRYNYNNKHRDGGGNGSYNGRSSSNHHESNHYRDNFHRRSSR